MTLVVSMSKENMMEEFLIVLALSAVAISLSAQSVFVGEFWRWLQDKVSSPPKEIVSAWRKEVRQGQHKPLNWKPTLTQRALGVISWNASRAEVIAFFLGIFASGAGLFSLNVHWPAAQGVGRAIVESVLTGMCLLIVTAIAVNLMGAGGSLPLTHKAGGCSGNH
jgi:hypothetical protein